jgi:phosphatidylglycerol lysyltransferase
LGLGFAAFLPVFLIALAAALLSGAPGGVGPFELALLSLCPATDPAALLSGIVIYRVLYYAFPAIAAMIALIRPFNPLACHVQRPVPTLDVAPRAEVSVVRQNGGWVMTHAAGAAAVTAQGQSLVALFDPVTGTAEALLPQICTLAKFLNLLPIMYKTSAPSAVAARRAGWQVIHIADEARLSPHRFDLATPNRAALRRKLRKAATLGVRIQTAGPLPLAAMSRIDADWQRRKGGARGTTMGRFCPGYIGAQRVFCAWQDARLVGFVTFHRSRAEWCLDLMRACDDAPDGTMHALVHAAFAEATADSIPRLSLAATPACPDPSSAWMRGAAARVSRQAGGPGLRQFKSSFAPDWVPLYAAAPSRIALVLGLIDIALAVRRAPVTEPHHGDEDYEVAARLAS